MARLKILYFSVRPTELLDYLKKFARPDTILEAVIPEGKQELPDMVYYSYEPLVGKAYLRTFMKAEQDGYDAVVVGCWYDPVVREGREVVNIPIIGICEASLHIGALLGSKFSIIAGDRKWIPKMNENIRRYGLESKLASWRVLKDEKGKFFRPEQFRTEREKVERVLFETAKKCIDEDGAEVILLACGGLEWSALELGKRLRVPVVPPNLAGLKVAELLADLYRNARLGLSRAGAFYIPEERLKGVKAILKK